MFAVSTYDEAFDDFGGKESEWALPYSQRNMAIFEYIPETN